MSVVILSPLQASAKSITDDRDNRVEAAAQARLAEAEQVDLGGRRIASV
jgi:hypothetical protein